MSEQKQDAVCEASPQGWHGPFYYNRDDRRVWVRKRRGYGYGWTFNFARPATYAIILAVLVVPVIVSFAIAVR